MIPLPHHLAAFAVALGSAAGAPTAMAAPADDGPAPALTFTAMGCGPYNAADMAAARFYMERENALPAGGRSAFVVHLGDICAGADAKAGRLTEATYSDIRDLLVRRNTLPAYIVPGDNEWNDRPDPDAGWALWSKHLIDTETANPPAWETERQDVRGENFAFVANGVLVIGINLVGGRIHDHAEWLRRFGEDNDWVEAQFAEHRADARAAVVCCQANVVGQGKVKPAVNTVFLPFRKRFGELAAEFGKPVLFLHADGHVWTVDNPWSDAPNITRVQVDRLEPRFPPVQIRVFPEDAEQPFRFDRRLDDPAWKAPK